MIKILHVTLMPVLAIGQARQLESETAAASSLRAQGVEWDTVVICRENTPFDLHQVTLPRWSMRFQLPKLFTWVWLLGESRRYDYVLVRAMSADVFAPFFMPLVRNLITVHHTKEIEEQAVLLRGLRRIAAVMIEKRSKPWAARRLLGVVGVTGEIRDYELQRFPWTQLCGVYPNGIDFDFVPVVADLRASSKFLQLVFVASEFYEWHGLDLLLDSIEHERGELRPFQLHLVGDISVKDRVHLERMENKWNIVRHGSISSADLHKLYSQCDLAIGSLALHRKGLSEACTLKVREYLAAGLPVYATHRDSALGPEFPHFRFDKDGISLSRMLRFADECRSLSRQRVREQSREFIEKREIMRSLAETLDSRVKGSAT